MIPDFDKRTVEVISKRAAYTCSNPDCRVLTVGPSIDRTESVVIGEAAHIYGARPKSKRYRDGMTDTSRAEITNAIWLCRNCHKMIDSDDTRFTGEVLLDWRELHDEYVASNLGSSTDKILYEHTNELLKPYRKYPSIVRRIIIDKPAGYEWRLAAELLRYLNIPLFRKLSDLRKGMYIDNQEILNEGNTMDWIWDRVAESEKLISPIKALLDRLTKSFGPPGKEGDIDEIHHTCVLISKFIQQVIKYEERLYFAKVPAKYKKLLSLLKDNLGSQVEKLANIPDQLDSIISKIGTDHGGSKEEPLEIHYTIVFEVPEGWAEEFNKEVKRVIGGGLPQGCMYVMGIIIFIILVTAIL